MSQDANTLLQVHFKNQGLHLTRPQFTNILYGQVLQTDVSIASKLPVGATSPIPTGMMTVSVSSLGNNYVTEPIPYPSHGAPKVGTTVSVGFTPNGIPICVAIHPLTEPPTITGHLSAITDTNARAVLTSIIAALVSDSLAIDGTT
jgi:uncharacterized PurR-regulated membrane protein YhhQ (DUF165 family)